jgi:hypothetical protein
MQQVSATAIPNLIRSYLPLLATGLLLLGCRKEETASYSVPKEAASPAPPKAATASPAVPSTAPVQWTTPAGWQEQPPSAMRVGSFVITKDDRHAEVSIIPLQGVSGGELANVNRWRGQVGLEPVDEAKLLATAEKVSIGNAPASLYEMAGTDPKTQQPSRIVGSILSSGGTTWFFKMTGNDALVAEQKPVFKEFLKTIHFDSAQPSDQLAQATGPMNMNFQSLPPAPGDAAADKPTWDVPTGWQEQPASAMRLATFRVTGENAAKADVSVIKLAGDAGGVLANVNRWRSQLGLQPVDQAGLEPLLTTREVGGTKILVVDMAGQSAEEGEKSRLLAAIVPRAGNTWFYKMLGSDQLVAQQKPAFTKFVESARYPNAS